MRGRTKLAALAALFVAGLALSITLSGSLAATADDAAVFCSEFVPNMEGSNQYAGWASRNTSERDAWVSFRSAICAGQSPTPPVIVTGFGKALVAAGKEALPEGPVVITTTTTTTTPPPPPTGEPAPIAGQGYHQVFGDEFDVFSPSWGAIWWNPTVPPNSIYAQDGILHLVSRRSQNYQDIILSTESSATGHWRQGYFEAQMRWTKGAGAWPAFWLAGYAHAQGQDCPPLNAELDIFEGQGTEPSIFYGTLHKNTNGLCGIPDQTNDGYHPVGVDLTAAFHTYSVLWTTSTVIWYLDGVEVTRFPAYASTDQELFILLQMWIGGWTGGTNSSTPDELQTEVDWVHVWQK